VTTEAEFNTEITHLLRKLWYWPITGTDAFVCEKCGHVTRPQKGRPDILAMGTNTRSLAVECKMIPSPAREGAQPELALKKITPEQRTWLYMFELDLHPCYKDEQERSFLALCTSFGRAGSIPNPRRAWLIPWLSWELIECDLRKLLPNRVSIPLLTQKGQSRIMQDANFCLHRLLKQYELTWVNKEGWKISKPLHCLYDAQFPRHTEELSDRWKNVLAQNIKRFGPEKKEDK